MPPQPSSPRRNPGRPITADDLFALHLVSDPQPAPDGRRVAYVVTRLDKEADEYRAAIWVAPLDGGEPVQLTNGAARDTTPRWSPDGATIAFVSNRAPSLTPPPAPAAKRDKPAGDEKPKKPAGSDDKPKNQIWLIAPDGGEARQLTRQRHGVTDPVWAPDGRAIAFLSPVGPDDDPDRQWTEAAPEPVADERIITKLRYRGDGRSFINDRYAHLWTIPADGGDARQLTVGDSDDDQPAWSPDGARIAFVSNRTPDRDRNRVSALYVVPAADGETRPLVETDAVFSSPSWSPDGSRLALLGHDDAGAYGKNVNLWTVTATGDALTNHTAAWDRSLEHIGMSDVAVAADQRPRWLPDGAAVLALASDEGSTHVYRISLDGGEVTPVTSGPRQVSSVALTANGRRIVFCAGTVDTPPEIFTADLDGGNERAVSSHNRAFLDEVALSPAEELWAPSQAGDREIQGWVLKPPGFQADSGVKYPLIVQIHGGPHAMYGHALYHEMQLMAARGYVVLFTNPRGSGGYGQEFTTCTRARWGEADMPDILGALDTVVGRGYVDETRVGLTGGSYGGYLTNWIIGHSDRFRAAVTQRCVSNFHSMYGTSDIGFDFGEYEFGGTPWANAAHLLHYSPISYVEQIATPLLILHSEQDLRCPIEQAEQLFVALKRLDKEVVFVRVPEENHNLSRSGTPSRRLARLHHLLGWFDSHL